MALRNKVLKIFLLFVGVSFNQKAYSKIILPELLAKQAVANIRFLSQDGKFTYYQKNSGSLLYSSNYKVFEMIKASSGTQYTVIGSNSRKKIIVMQNENFHTFYSLRSREKIYLVDFGGTTLREIGKGANAQLHQDDTWLSYYDYYSKTITFESTANSASRFSIKLNNRINPYFTPQVVMSDQNTIFYSDLGENGSVGLLQYQRTTGKSELVFKAKTPMVRAEICLNNNQLIMSLIGLNSSQEGTSISKISLPVTKDISNREIVYTSPINDVGQLICNTSNNLITFIKNYGESDQFITDVVELNLLTKEVKLLSEMRTITSVMNMDGTILAIDKGKYFIVKGNLDFKNIDSLKSLPPAGFGEAIKKIDEELNNE